MSDKTFDLIVEGVSDDLTRVTPNAHEFRGLAWSDSSPPDVIVFGDKLLVKIGRYAAPGDRYRYRVAVTADLVDGKLVAR